MSATYLLACLSLSSKLILNSLEKSSGCGCPGAKRLAVAISCHFFFSDFFFLAWTENELRCDSDLRSDNRADSMLVRKAYCLLRQLHGDKTHVPTEAAGNL